MIDSLRDKHFRDLCRRMESHTGIQLPPGKRTMLEGRLRKRVRVLGVDSLEAYGVLLFEGGQLETEFAHLVDNVTTNKTDFFREPDHFDFLREFAIPKLLSRRDRDTRLKLWSAACSIGAEAFTMAMVLDAMQTKDMSFPFAILGTDISNIVLAQAKRAIYPSGMGDMIPASMRIRYTMQPSDPSRAEFRIVAALRSRVHFTHLNLMDSEYPFDRDVDIIFCRNILIYFAKTDQQSVLERLTSHLRPGGYLVLGHSESFALDDKSRMAQIAPTIFQRLPAKASRQQAA